MSYWNDININECNHSHSCYDGKCVSEKELVNAKDDIIATTKEYADNYTVEQTKTYAEGLQTAYEQTMNDRTTTFENGIDTRVTATETTVGGFDTRLTTAEGDITSLGGRVTTIEGLVDPITVPDASVGLKNFERGLYIANVNVNSSGDASTTLNNLINEIPENSTLIIPNGTIRITSPIVVNKKINIVSYGKIYAVNSDVFDVRSECSIDANAECATSGKSIFIFTTDNVSRVFIKGNYIYRNNFIYVHAKGIYDIICNGAKIKFNRTTDTTHGTVIYAESTAENQCGEFVFVGCFMGEFRRLAYMKDCNTLRFIGCVAESAYVTDETLFTLNNSRNCCFIGNRFIEIVNSCDTFIKIINKCWGLQYFGNSYDINKLNYSEVTHSAGLSAHMKFGNVYDSTTNTYYDNYTVTCEQNGTIHTFSTELTEIS